MKCNICGKEKAVLYIQEIIGNERRVIHICKECNSSKQCDFLGCRNDEQGDIRRSTDSIISKNSFLVETKYQGVSSPKGISIIFDEKPIFLPSIFLIKQKKKELLGKAINITLKTIN